MSFWDKTINSWISDVKEYGETIANEQSQNGKGDYQITEITCEKGGLTLMVESREFWTLNKLNLDLDKQLCYCTCLSEMFEGNYLRGKYNKSSEAPLLPSIIFCILLWGF